jgi:hypothetical protein
MEWSSDEDTEEREEKEGGSCIASLHLFILYLVIQPL